MSYRRFEADDSYCCSGQHVHLWWVNGSALPPPSSIESILDQVEQLLTSGGRYWNDHMLQDRLGQVEGLLERATQGRLKPITEIKGLNRPAPRRLFELRHAIDVEYRIKMGDVTVDRKYEEELLRIYHAETSRLPSHALGLHLHFKATDKDVNELQDEEIDTAVEVYDLGETQKWGIPH